MAVGFHTRLIEAAYRRALKPLLFRMDPEVVHDRVTRAGRFAAASGIGRVVTRSLFHFEHPMLANTVAGIRFTNPVGLAAGFDKNAHLWNILPDVGFGFAELGSVTGQPCAGNPRPRLWRIPKHDALQVHYGLNSDGTEAVRACLQSGAARIPLGISAAKTNNAATADAGAAVADYVRVVSTFADVADYFTINISCPNAFGGQPFTSPELLDRLLSTIDSQGLTQPVFIKLSPDLSEYEIDALLEVMAGHRVAGIVCTNLTKDESKMGIPKSDIPGSGGISGRPVRALADAQLLHVAHRTQGRYTLIGVGGVFSAEDAYRKLRYGASLVQLITGMIYRGPQLIGQLNHALVELLRRDGFTNVADAVGADVR
jgi:dihydroorotate dehydrogenase